MLQVQLQEATRLLHSELEVKVEYYKTRRDKEMLFHRVREVEFVGGPFDGHRQTIRLSKDDCQQAIVIPVNENLYRRLAGLPPVPNAGVSSYAVYELRKRDREYRYYFTTAKPPSEFDADSQRF